MTRANALSYITEQAKNKVYDEYYENTVMPNATKLAEEGKNESEIIIKFFAKDVDVYYERLLTLLKADNFIIVKSIKPSTWTRQDLYIKFSW